MSKVKLTDLTIKKQLEEGQQRLDLFDTLLPGFGLRIGAGGRRTYFAMVRVAGRQRRIKVGTTDTHTLADARKEAREIMENASKGVAPDEAKRRAKADAERAASHTFRHAAEAWLADTGRGGGAGLRSKRALERRLECDVYPKWGALPVVEIRRADVRELIDGIAKDRPVAANRTLALVRRVFNWAMAKDRIDASPAAGIEPPGRETSRDRVLTDDELRRVWRGGERLGGTFGAAFKMMLLTGQRRNEVGGMRRSELDGDLWIIPAARSKNGRGHTVPLAPAAVEVLDALPVIVDEDGAALDHVFAPGTVGRRNKVRDRAVSGWGMAKARLDKAIAEAEAEAREEALDPARHGLAPWTIHDLRRTVRTNLPRLGATPDTAERVLGHAIGGVRGVYDRHAYDREKRAALEAWAAHVERLITGAAAADNVVQLAAGA